MPGRHARVGAAVGVEVGVGLGSGVGSSVGSGVGYRVGVGVGTGEGMGDGMGLGAEDGCPTKNFGTSMLRHPMKPISKITTHVVTRIVRTITTSQSWKLGSQNVYIWAG